MISPLLHTVWTAGFALGAAALLHRRRTLFAVVVVTAWAVAERFLLSPTMR